MKRGADHRGLKQSLAVIGSGILVGTLFYAVDAPRHSIAPAAREVAASRSNSRGSGVYTMQELLPRKSPGAPAVPLAAPAPQAPALPFSYLGKITEDGATTILLHGDGKTYKVRGPGSLDDRYRVDSIREDRLVIRYVPLETEQVLELSARQYEVPPGLRGEYPQD